MGRDSHGATGAPLQTPKCECHEARPRTCARGPTRGGDAHSQEAPRSWKSTRGSHLDDQGQEMVFISACAAHPMDQRRACWTKVARGRCVLASAVRSPDTIPTHCARLQYQGVNLCWRASCYRLEEGMTVAGRVAACRDNCTWPWQGALSASESKVS